MKTIKAVAPGLFLCTVALVPLSAHAQSVFQGNVIGSFANAAQSATDYVLINNNDQGAKPFDAATFQWGTAGFGKSCSNKTCKTVPLPQSGSSGTSFDGVGSDPQGGGFSTGLSQAFYLGGFDYTNRSMFYDTGVTGVDLDLDLGIASPFTYRIAISNISDDPKPTADTISLINPVSPYQFTFGGNSYAFTLLGFSKDNGQSFLSSLSVNENASTHVGLFGRLDAVVVNPPVPATAPVPVPAAAWLMGSGLVGLAGLARRRKQA